MKLSEVVAESLHSSERLVIFEQEKVERWGRPIFLGLSIILLLGAIVPYLISTFEAASVLSTPIGHGPQKIKIVDFYEFDQVPLAFGAVELDRISELEAVEFKEMLLSSIPRPFLRERLREFLPFTMSIAQKYQVDPFWVLAIMWTESHFKPGAVSRVDARGLMQVLPGTAHFVLHLMDRPVSPKVAYELVKNPYINIELGVFYMKRLLNAFNGNYRLATVAYNMGPGGVRRRLRLRLPVGVRNNYLNKVTRHYEQLTKLYEARVMSRLRPYELTYVVQKSFPRTAEKEDKKLMAFLQEWRNLQAQTLPHVSFVQR